MKINVINVSESSGLSKKNDQPFCIRQVTFLGEFEQVSTEKYQRSGSGLIPIDLNVSDNFFKELEQKFESSFKGNPLVMNLSTVLNSRGNTIIVGFESN